MTQRGWLIGGAAIAALLIYNRGTVMSLAVSSAEAMNNQNVRAFMAMIRRFESNGRYDVLYGGGTFSDFSDHPDIKVPFNNPAKAPHKDGTPNDYSTAAGAYQINYPTWMWVYPLIDGSDFSPQSQDEACIVLLKKCGALQAIIDGDFQGAIDAASGTWASLPGSTSGQRKVSIQTALNAYASYGGAIA